MGAHTKLVLERDELLSGGGVDNHGGVELALGQACAHRDAYALDDLGGISADQVGTPHPLAPPLAGREEPPVMKLIVDAASQRVVGAHMVGADAPEIIQGIGIAVRAGLTKSQFDATVGIHPTAAEEFVTLKDKLRVRAH